MVGVATTNAMAFSGSNFLFSMLRNKDIDKECKIHALMNARDKYSYERTERLDYINKTLRRQGHVIYTFKDVDNAMSEYSFLQQII